MSEEQKSNEKKSKMEIAEKVADVIEKTALKADSLVSNAKSKSGDHGSKVMVGLLVILALAIYSNPGLGLTAIVVFALLFLKPILGMVKKLATKEPEKKSEDKK